MGLMTARDVSQIIDVLSDKLGTTADQIFSVLTAQAKIYAIKGAFFCIAYLAFIILTAVFVHRFFLKKSCEIKQYGSTKKVTVFSKLADNEETGACAALSAIGVLLVSMSFVLVFIIDSIASDIINAIFNPEFWALDYLLENFM